ncbi:MAG: hypothetical protein ACI9U2_002528, partial [Bradymonadia bacterium]
VDVHVFVPTGGKIERSRLPGNYPVVYLWHAGTRVNITFTSSGGLFAKALTAQPPTLVGQPLKRFKKAHGTYITMRKTEQGLNVVGGFVRGARCVANDLSDVEAEIAFALCAGVRAAPPGPLGVGQSHFARVPARATLEHRPRITKFELGQVVGKVLPKPCPSGIMLKKRDPDTALTLRMASDRSAVWVGRASQTNDSGTYRTLTTVWATRQGHCCVASILEHVDPPTEAQVDYLVRICGE